MSASTPKRSKQPASLLSLPAELRNHIYHLLLVSTHPINLVLESAGHRTTVRIQNWYEASPSADILATCHQIHHEASAYLYSDNTFTFRQDPRALGAFLARIKKSAQLVRKIDIQNPYSNRFGRLALEALQYASNLTKLEIVYVPGSVYGVYMMAGLLLPWARTMEVESMKGLEALKFYHVALPSDHMGALGGARPKLVNPYDEMVAEEYAVQVKRRILRLLGVEMK